MAFVSKVIKASLSWGLKLSIIVLTECLTISSRDKPYASTSLFYPLIVASEPIESEVSTMQQISHPNGSLPAGVCIEIFAVFSNDEIASEIASFY